MANLGRAVQQLRSERDRLQTQIDQLDKAIRTLAGLNGSGRRSRGGGARQMSAAARKRIAAAQKARWAKWKASHY